MIYFTSDLDDKTYEDKYKIIYYEGSELLEKEQIRGTYDSINGKSQVGKSAWKHDLAKSAFEDSPDDVVGQNYKMFKCAMYRSLDDVTSTV